MFFALFGNSPKTTSLQGSILNGGRPHSPPPKDATGYILIKATKGKPQIRISKTTVFFEK